MDKREANSENSELKAKKQKTSDDTGENRAGPSNSQAEAEPEPEADIFKLNPHCFFEIFDRLMLRDLNSLAQTCKTMQKIAGAFFEKQYKTVHAEFENGTIRTGHFALYMVNLSGLSPFIRKIVIKSDEEEELFYFNTKCKESIKEIKFENVTLNESKVEMIKDIVGKAEVIKLYMCQFDGDFFEGFLKLATNLKHLSIENNYFS